MARRAGRWRRARCCASCVATRHGRRRACPRTRRRRMLRRRSEQPDHRHRLCRPRAGHSLPGPVRRVLHVCGIARAGVGARQRRLSGKRPLRRFQPLLHRRASVPLAPGDGHAARRPRPTGRPRPGRLRCFCGQRQAPGALRVTSGTVGRSHRPEDQGRQPHGRGHGPGSVLHCIAAHLDDTGPLRRRLRPHRHRATWAGSAASCLCELAQRGRPSPAAGKQLVDCGARAVLSGTGHARRRQRLRLRGVGCLRHG